MLKSDVLFVTSARPNFYHFPRNNKEIPNSSPQINVKQTGLLIKPGLNT
jgi:hypothetical protein